MSATVLLVDDDPHLCELLAARLRRQSWTVITCASAAAALDGLAGDAPVDGAIVDVRLGAESGLDLCRALCSLRPGMPVIVITGDDDADAAVGALRAGAFDFIRKPIDLGELSSTLDRAVRKSRLETKVRRLPSQHAESPPWLGGILGRSQAMRDVCALVERVAPIESAVLITGENGTGKEMIARALHDNSRRRAGPFVAVNCAAIPESLIESELFGHVKGAFTDARADRKGLFAQAAGGSLFLDEIGDLPVRLQAKLLRVLQERTMRPVGSDREIATDVRVLSATNRNLTKGIAEGTFREDLYYRISVIHIALPPLRVREDDLLVLAQSFVDRFAQQLGKPITGLTSAVAEALLAYPWPGNVRELQNSIEHAVALARYDLIRVDDLPERLRGYEPRPDSISAPAPERATSLEEMQRQHIDRVLELAGGNKSEAARLLGLSRRTLHRRVAREAHAGGAPRGKHTGNT